MWGLVLASFVLHPMLQRVLRTPKGVSPSTRQLVQAGGVVLGALVVYIYLTHQGEVNFFQELEVPRSAENRHIKAAYKKKSILLHPDKNPAPDAQEQFIRLKEIYDILIDSRAREAYDKFGPSLLRNSQYEAIINSSGSLFWIHAPFYAIMIILVLAVTASTTRAAARFWALLLLFITLVLDLLMRYAEYDFFTGIFPYTTIYEKVQILQAAATFLLNVAYIYSEVTYIDLEHERHQEQLERLELILDYLEAEPWDRKKARQAAEESPEKEPSWKFKMGRKRILARNAQVEARRGKAGIPWGMIIWIGFMALQMYLSRSGSKSG
eukprot:m.132615 g.132615  ORF g.132615 m.132615 type:complete len:324 (-) comp23776_c0_seq2:116-1087(-)